MKKVKIILASKSPRRIAILKQIGANFESIPSTFTEKEILGDVSASSVKKLTISNAKGKAMDVANKLGNGIFLGVDTLAVCENKILGKPKDSKDAKNMLNFLSGKMHQVFSAIALIKKEKSKLKVLSACDVAKVYFKFLSDKEIDDYVVSGEPLDKAGGYGVQEKGARFIRKIVGDYYTVVGLPLARLLNICRKMNIEI
ncbi:MAG: Maf family protein [Candidatus Levybacteria bacterium]|nr:Maf family protein [Candidatus Levybacteria bacterium]